MERKAIDLIRSGLRGAALLGGALCAADLAAAGIVYVDRNAPGGDGSSWASAFRGLDAALAHAAGDPSVDQIWIAAGVYRPGGSFPTRSHSFVLVDGVSLLGGFPLNSHGSAPDLSLRDPALHATVLSGDIDGDGTHVGNSFHVLSAPAVAAVLDGLRIVGGNADGTPGTPDGFGGGLYAHESQLELRDCRFLGNRAEAGGAAALLGGSAVLERCQFLDNRSWTGPGGALFATAHASSDSVCIRRSRFVANNGALEGGAIYSGTNLELLSCEFVGNLAGTQGGALAHRHASAKLLHGTLSANSASLQGGALSVDGADLIVDRSILWQNSAPTDPEVHVGGSGAVLISTSCVSGAASLSFADPYCFDEDPRFLDQDGPDGIVGNVDDDLRLACFSPCVDRGPSPLLGTCSVGYLVDLAGEPRSNPDVGAYELPTIGIRACFGDGSGTPPPCGNASAVDDQEGAANSTGHGARLCAAGSRSVSRADLRIQAQGLIPSGPAVLIAGLNLVGGGAGATFGDGLRCLAGGIVRSGVRIADAQGRASWGPGLVHLLGVPAGGTRRFQAWYRDPAGPCASGFNLSSALSVTFVE